MNKITIAPVKKFRKEITCVPDKSITHRALMFNGAAAGAGEVKGMLLGDDCLSTLNCMRALGADITLRGDTASITGAKKFRSADLYAGNSGTTMRLLCGLLASRPGAWTLSGDASLSRRPMRRVTDPLALMGGNIAATDGHAPLSVTGAKLHAIDYDMPVASAQVKSALILAALGAEGETHIRERELTRDHTEIMLESMGADIRSDGGLITVRGGRELHGISVTVAGDISSAAFPLAAGLITGGETTVKNVGLNPTRTGILEVFDQIGADYSVWDERTEGGEKVGNITVRSLGAARPFTVSGDMIPRLVDEIPVLCVLACYLCGDSEIKDAAELRVKESDRIALSLEMLRLFGGKCEETESGMTISGTGGLEGGVAFDPRGDHRMAMSAAVAAAGSAKSSEVLDPDCASVSYPDFWKLFEE